MPRRERTTEVKVTRRGALTAAAVRYVGGSRTAKKVKKAPEWHEQAWLYYNSIGEFRYACNWVGNLLSRATLTVYKDGEPVEANDPSAQILAGLYGGPEGQREMLRQLGINLTVGGDAWIFGEEQGDGDRWEVAAAARVRQDSDGTFRVGKREITDPLAIHIWRSHPANYEDVDSPARAVLMILDEIAGLTAGVKAQIQSRLAGAGLLPIPSEISFGSIRSSVPTDEADMLAQGVVKDIDALLIELAESMMEAIEDPSSPVARVPILLQIPGEYVDKIKPVTFWTPLDAETKTLRDEAIRRLALGMDMPPEVLTGSGELNHWNAWQIEEASIKSHTEPMLHIITSSLAAGFLHPALEDEGMEKEEARRYSIHADTSEIRLRPNRSREAIELYEHGVLSEDAMIRENGFKPEDKMGDEERTKFYTRKVAGGSTTPELVAYALSILGVNVPVSSLQPVVPTQERPSPSIAEHPEREIPDERDVAAAEPMVFRALERAGARLRAKYKDSLVTGAEGVHNADLYRFTRMTPIMVDEVLADAWDELGRFRISIGPVVLDDYVRHLFRSGEPFDPDGYRRFVSRHAG